MKRPETGTMQFGDDWPGVFIRGDNAAGYAFYIEQVLGALAAGAKPNPAYCMAIGGLRRLLLSCDVRENQTPQKAILEPGEPARLSATEEDL